MNTDIHSLQKEDIHPIAAAFARLGWDKPASQYERYLAEQDAGQREVYVATLAGEFAGYITIVWQSHYPYFKDLGIPEMVDFNVLPKFKRQGIGTRLMDEAEMRISEKSEVAGIGVGVTPDYGAAHILYIQRGYIPDGRGIIKDGCSLQYGDQVTIDDDLAIFFTKQL